MECRNLWGNSSPLGLAQSCSAVIPSAWPLAQSLAWPSCGWLEAGWALQRSWAGCSSQGAPRGVGDATAPATAELQLNSLVLWALPLFLALLCSEAAFPPYINPLWIKGQPLQRGVVPALSAVGQCTETKNCNYTMSWSKAESWNVLDDLLCLCCLLSAHHIDCA